MDGNDGTLAYLPCEEHQEKKRRCDPKKCGKGKWKTVESKRIVCDTCKKRKKTCTHKLPGVQAPINPEPDPGLSTFQKPASGKSKRAQEVPAAGTSSTASKPAASGGKSKRAQEVPGSSTAPEKPASGFGWLYTLQNPGGNMVFFDEIDDPEVLRQLKWYGGSQQPDLAEKYRLEEEAYEEGLFGEGYRDLVRAPAPVPNEGAALTQEEQEAAQDFCSNNALR